ncbi:hypothetical protein NLG42_19625 [Flavobacterium plurextorum]|uniref:hypothetical protein n=1 Tax=Flavobacterium TaxID=237 RepID=UPI00214D518E|nr:MULTISPECIES: hypothetical protein [Flavobacterium]UUW08305.1 hypothetical protein NLG42_19625 [Flavobacterium plurextorum]
MDLLNRIDFWALVVAVIGLAYYLIDRSSRSEKRHMLEVFKDNQRISLNVQDILNAYMSRFGKTKRCAFANKDTTLGNYYDLIVEEHKLKLSDELYEFIKKEKISKPTLKSRIDSLNRQNEALKLIELEAKLMLNKANEANDNFFVL